MSLTINHNLMAMNSARNLGDHYGALNVSTRRLSSGLRIGTSADDAAGLAIREMMRSEVKSLHQGIRNANDAISMVQTADGALQVIDEKLIRMKELAMQASTGTYNSDQRLIIDSEFQAMKSEIERIAQSTEFNGIHLLNGSISTSTSSPAYLENMSVHYTFDNTYADEEGGANAIAYNNVTLNGTNARIEGQSGDFVLPATPTGGYVEVPQIDWSTYSEMTLSMNINEDTIASPGQVAYITYSNLHVGIHRSGTNIQFRAGSNVLNVPFDNVADRDTYIRWTMSLTGDSFSVYKNDTLVAQDTTPVAIGAANPAYADEHNIGINYWTAGGRRNAARFVGNVEDFRIYSTGLTEDEVVDLYNQSSTSTTSTQLNEQDVLVHFGAGNDSAEDYYDVAIGSVTTEALGVENTRVQTQSNAQEALGQIDDAIVYKDGVRAHLGAMQNRLENTISNLEIQAENLQASESRISDVDVAQEMTEFVRRQILTQSAVAMLAQENSLPRMAMQLIGG
jgi:flagellin